MKYRIVGNTMPAVEIMFDSVGESVFTQSGGMTWMAMGSPWLPTPEAVS